MKIYKTKWIPAIPAREERVEDKTTCDICGKDITQHFSYDVSECEISMEEGERYPECTDINKTSFDICPTCFKDKLTPFIKSFQNADPTITEIEY